MAYYNRRTISKAEKPNPFDDNGKLKKGFRYTGNGEIKDKIGNTYLIKDFK